MFSQVMNSWNRFYNLYRGSNLSRVDVLLRELAHQPRATLPDSCTFRNVGIFVCADYAQLVDLGAQGVCIAIRPPPEPPYSFPTQRRAGSSAGLTLRIDAGLEQYFESKQRLTTCFYRTFKNRCPALISTKASRSTHRM